MKCSNVKLSMKIGSLLSGYEGQEIDLSDVSVTEMFEFSGLTRWAWCESLVISDALWSQYRCGGVKVPEKIREKAINLALTGAAMRLNAVKIVKPRKNKVTK